jgi:hypothetical protein
LRGASFYGDDGLGCVLAPAGWIQRTVSGIVPGSWQRWKLRCWVRVLLEVLPRASHALMITDNIHRRRTATRRALGVAGRCAIPPSTSRCTSRTRAHWSTMKPPPTKLTVRFLPWAREATFCVFRPVLLLPGYVSNCKHVAFNQLLFILHAEDRCTDKNMKKCRTFGGTSTEDEKAWFTYEANIGESNIHFTVAGNSGRNLVAPAVQLHYSELLELQRQYGVEQPDRVDNTGHEAFAGSVATGKYPMPASRRRLAVPASPLASSERHRSAVGRVSDSTRARQETRRAGCGRSRRASTPRSARATTGGGGG